MDSGVFYNPLDFWALEVHIFGFPCKIESRFVCFIVFCLVCGGFLLGLGFFLLWKWSHITTHALGIRKKENLKDQSLVIGSQELAMLWFISVFDVHSGCGGRVWNVFTCTPVCFPAFAYGVSCPETWPRTLCTLGWGCRRSQAGSWSHKPEKPLVFVIKCRVFQVPLWSRVWTFGLLAPLRALLFSPTVLLVHIFICRKSFLLSFWLPEDRSRRNSVEKLNRNSLFRHLPHVCEVWMQNWRCC